MARLSENPSLVTLVLGLAGPSRYLWQATVCKAWHAVYVSMLPDCSTADATCLESRSQLIMALELRVPSPSNLFGRAARLGKVELLQTLAERGHIDDRKHVMLSAARSGSLPAVMYLHELLGFDMDAPVVCSAAAHGGVELIEWMLANDAELTPKAIVTAARTGNIAALELLVPAAPVPRDLVLTAAAQTNRIAVMEWAEGTKRLPFVAPRQLHFAHSGGISGGIIGDSPFELPPMLAAAQAGHVEAMAWLTDHGYEWGASIWLVCSAAGRLNCLRWLAEHSGEAPVLSAAARVFSAAAGAPEFEPGSVIAMCELLLEMGCAWDKRACNMAAEAGRLEVLQWLRGHGCPWDGSTLRAAADHPDVYQWAVERGCPEEESDGDLDMEDELGGGFGDETDEENWFGHDDLEWAEGHLLDDEYADSFTDELDRDEDDLEPYVGYHHAHGAVVDVEVGEAAVEVDEVGGAEAIVCDAVDGEAAAEEAHEHLAAEEAHEHFAAEEAYQHEEAHEHFDADAYDELDIDGDYD